MRTAVPLYQFMPYGAPELLESRRRHLSRALLLTSAMALGLCALTGGIASLLPQATVPAQRQIVVEPRAWEFVTPEAPPLPERVELRARVVDERAIPIPVEDELITPPTEAPPIDGREGGNALSAPPASSQIATGEGAREVLPSRDVWVYVEELPAPVHEVKPEYPPLAQQAGVDGVVLVHVLVGTDGRVRDAVLSDKIHIPMLDGAALAAARQWVFTPGLANGKPVACWISIPFRFGLR